MAARPRGISMILLEAIRGAAHVEPEGGAAFGQRAATWNASALAIWDDADDRRRASRLGARVGRPAVGRLADRRRLCQLRAGRRIHRARPARLRQRALRPAGGDQGALRPGQPVPVQPERRPGLNRSGREAGPKSSPRGQRSLPHSSPARRRPGCTDQIGASRTPIPQRGWTTQARTRGPVAAADSTSLVRGAGTRRRRRHAGRGARPRPGPPVASSGRTSASRARRRPARRAAGPAARRPEQLLAACLERDATLVQRDRGLERLTAGLELGDGPLELDEGVVERERVDRGVSRRVCRRRHPQPRRCGSMSRSIRGARSIPSRTPTTATTATISHEDQHGDERLHPRCRPAPASGLVRRSRAARRGRRAPPAASARRVCRITHDPPSPARRTIA